MKLLFLSLCLVLALMGGVTPVGAEERIELEGARIFGDREQPNITYIFPWREDALSLLNVQSIQTLYERSLNPVEPARLRRQIDFYRD